MYPVSLATFSNAETLVHSHPAVGPLGIHPTDITRVRNDLFEGQSLLPIGTSQRLEGP